MGEPEPSHMIARQIASLKPCLCASPRYLDRNGEPSEPSELAKHQCLRMPKTNSWMLNDGTHTVKAAVGGRFSLNSVGLVRRLATLDIGIANLPEEIVADDVADGRLRRIMPQWRGAPTPVYAITETRLLPAKTQRFIEFVRQRLKRA
jgi:DNA-binding transcriptional LysR family regulator